MSEVRYFKVSVDSQNVVTGLDNIANAIETNETKIFVEKGALDAANAEIGRLKEKLKEIEQARGEGCAMDASQVKLDDDNEKYKRALNRIAIIGSGEKAYTADFTNEVMGIVREVLNEN